MTESVGSVTHGTNHSTQGNITSSVGLVPPMVPIRKAFAPDPQIALDATLGQGTSLAAEALSRHRFSERRVTIRRARGSYVVRRPQAYPLDPERWWTLRQLLHDLGLLAGVVLAVLFIAAILWLPALVRP